MISGLLDEFNTKYLVNTQRIKQSDAVKKIFEMPQDEKGRYFHALLIRTIAVDNTMIRLMAADKSMYYRTCEAVGGDVWNIREFFIRLLEMLISRKINLNEETILLFLRWVNAENDEDFSFLKPEASFIKAVEHHSRNNELSNDIKVELEIIGRKQLSWQTQGSKTLFRRIEILLGREHEIPLNPGVEWTDSILTTLKAMEAEEKERWTDMIIHCGNAEGGSPSAKWLKRARELEKKVNTKEFKRNLLLWLESASKQPLKNNTQPHSNDNDSIDVYDNRDVLKGLVWCSLLIDDNKLPIILSDIAVWSYSKIPDIGARAMKVGNACVYVLSMSSGIESVAQLSILKTKVKLRNVQKGIQKALEKISGNMGITVEDLEELGVPDYGMKEAGVFVESFGDCTGRFIVSGVNTSEIVWEKDGGKAAIKIQKAVPAQVKKEYGDALKAFRSHVKEIKKMISAQQDRIDKQFIRKKTWNYRIWRERYLDHPLMGILARKIIWRFSCGDKRDDAIYLDGRFINVKGKIVDWIDEQTGVSLWHPIEKTTGEITGWRDFLRTNNIVQPVKQAHREIYLLTDAEKATRVYSNRFAAHIIKQHQFNALCAVRGWRNSLQLLVDSEYNPTHIELPEYGLRAEFWADGIGDDTNDVGTYYYLATDQVRFYEINQPITRGNTLECGLSNEEAEAMPLEQIDPLVLSEVFRDVDLFVGVASVGNDPNWFDGGPDGTYRDYWERYSFGDLSETAKTRKQVLEELIPHLKIAERCSFTEKFLVVKGKLRTYKIHFGSTNILMEPDDEYLCIVAGRSATAPKGERVFLPFEGDHSLSVILSKAFLLAEDDRITDETILSQIK